MRPIPEWTEEDLQQFVRQKRHEDGELEYKDSRALIWPKGDNDAREKRLNEISKDVSAFANSNGGVLIYGIAEKDHIPLRVDEGVDPKTHGREWVEDIIRGNIQDPPPALRVYPIPVGTAGRVAHVVSVPMFPRGCQARDKRYYRRRNFRVDMLDDWEVRELLSRTVQPQVALHVGKQSVNHPSDEYFLVARLLNTGTTRVHDWKAQIEVPAPFIASSQSSHEHVLKVPDGRGGEYEARVWVFSNGHGGGALFPREEHEIIGGGGRYQFIRWRYDEERRHLARDLNVAVRWKLYADDLPEQSGAIHIRELKEIQ